MTLKAADRSHPKFLVGRPRKKIKQHSLYQLSRLKNETFNIF